MRNVIFAGVVACMLLGFLSFSTPCRGGPGEGEETAVEEKDERTRCFRMGFTPFPWDYGEDVRKASLAFVASNGGDIVLHHCDFCVPWPEVLAGEPIAPALEANWRGYPDKAFNTTPPDQYLPEGTEVFLALTPLDMTRSKLAVNRVGEVPDGFLDKAFDDPAIKAAYLEYCVRAVEHFQPDYLAIGIEVNELLKNRPERWPGFVTLYQHVYGELKKKHGDLPIFATITLHTLLNERGKSEAAERQAQLKAFLELNDIAGISFYPFLSGVETESELRGALKWLRGFVGDKSIALGETGFPAEATPNAMWPQLPGSPENQLGYFRNLFEIAQEEEYRFITVFLHRDYDRMWEKLKATRPGWQVAWRDIGLLNGEGEPRPAWDLWQDWLARQYVKPK